MGSCGYRRGMKIRGWLWMLAGAWALAEAVEAVAARTMVGQAEGPGVVVIPGFRNEDAGRINELNRWRVEAALSTVARLGPGTRCILTGGDPADSGVTEATHLAGELRRRGFQGEIIVEDQSRTTWENAIAVAPMLAGAGRIAIASQPLHGLKLRCLLARLDPLLQPHFVKAEDYRIAELGPARIITTVIGVGDLLRSGPTAVPTSGRRHWASQALSMVFTLAKPATWARRGRNRRAAAK